MTLAALLCALTALMVGLDSGRRFARRPPPPLPCSGRRPAHPTSEPGIRRMLIVAAYAAVVAGLVEAGTLFLAPLGQDLLWMMLITITLGGFALGALLPVVPTLPVRVAAEASAARLPTA
ncbi:hypothetical protein [Deinococcus aerophilus]|nr:hypothetical protein [Deinococcus aerophilus]